jgi:hypothetical protein
MNPIVAKIASIVMTTINSTKVKAFLMCIILIELYIKYIKKYYTYLFKSENHKTYLLLAIFHDKLN